nr:SusC/RagA family TonB-linked outer membrane protein [uncultured Flavobacterium sp.]
MKQALIKRCSFILFALMSIVTYAQTASSKIKITGTVTENSGGLMPGVNVTEKSSKNTVTTDYNGKYEINVKPGATLVFSFIGMKKIEIPLNGRTTLDARLQEDSNQLDNIVVVGYTSQKKSHLTGAVETIKMSEIADLPVGDLGTAIQGRVLGVGVSGGSTRPGVKSNLTIRQPYSLAKDGGNLSPLYVIDGVLQIGADGLNDSTLFDNLDSSEVESISFLKDAAAAIYGARSAQGVVLVTTKRGTKGDPKFSYSGSYGSNDKTYQSKMLNAYEFAQYVNIMNGPNGYNQTGKEYIFSNDELEYFKTLNNTYLDDEWKPSFNMRHNLNVSGGSEKATYFAGASYFQQNGNLSTLDYSKWNFRAGTDVKLSSNLKAGLQLSGYYSDQQKTFNKIGGEKEENDYNELLTHIPYIPNYVNGLPIELPNNNDGNQRYHYPEIQRLNNLAGTAASTMTVNMYTEYKVPFVKGLMARGSYARNMGHTRGTQVGTSYTLYQFKGLGENEHIFNDNITDAPIKPTGTKYNNGDILLFDNTTTLSEQLNLTVSYDRTFGKHSISGVFGIEKSEATLNKERVSKTNVLDGTNGQFTTANGAIDGQTNKSESGSLGYVGRLNYAYGDKYLAEFLFRSDASTKFAPEYYWGNFYSGSIGWVVSKEDFFESSTIDFLKFRYSVGLLGKDDTKAWLWKQRYSYQGSKGAVFGGNTDMTHGWKMEASPNPDATWSDEVKTNFGVDMRFLNNKLAVTAESYYNFGSDLLMNVTGNLPFTIGGTVAAQNYGKMDTFGVELAVGWNDKIGQDISYGIDMRFGWSDNKAIKGNYNNEDILKPWNKKPGESSDNGIWGYDYIGMFKNQEDIDKYVAQYNITAVKNINGDKSYTPSQLRPGMLYYRDVRGAYLGDGQFAAPDGIIDVNDQVRLSRKSDSHYGLGSTLRFAYKSFSFNTVINASFGGYSSIGGDARKAFKSKIPQIVDNTVSIWNNIYDPTLNPNGNMPNPAYVEINSVDSDFWEVNSFRIACRNITLSYALPQGALKAMNLSSCKLNFVALNPFNLYNPYSFQEPNGSYLDYPTLRTLSLGLNVGF